MKPLQGVLVLDFSQFLSGPSAALRLADLGARVIKIERPDTGDLCRKLMLHDQTVDGDSLLFHTINRNKESYAVNLKDPAERAKVKKLIGHADVIIENFRPGVMAKLGLGYEEVQRINPRIIYGSITGYGTDGPWRNKPGQDLLVQSVSGLAWLNGNADQPPVPFGLSVADLLAGLHLEQGILACLVRRGVTGRGGLVEVSLLESALDFQFEVLTTYLNDGRKPPVRSRYNNAHAYLGAPYGIYETKDGYMALAMGSLKTLASLLESEELAAYDQQDAFVKRDEIKAHIARRLKQKTTQEWLAILEPADYWCADVLDWRRLLRHEAFREIDMLQTVGRPGMEPISTTRSPLRVDGEVYKAPKGAPRIGEHNEAIEREFQLT
jgi:crotonobetainyl-CoA:carnitine CoA-transferase CaiB-like acyl-CoA transferase